MTEISEGLLRWVAPQTDRTKRENQRAVLKQLVPELRDHLPGFEIDTPIRLSHFVSQTARLTLGFTRLEQDASEVERSYQPEPGVPNVQEAIRFRERGLIGLRGRKQYSYCGQLIGLDLEADPELAARSDIAVMIACRFWQVRRINDLSDAGDVQGVTRALDGSYDSFPFAEAYLQRAKAFISRQASLVRRLSSLPPRIRSGGFPEATASRETPADLDGLIPVQQNVADARVYRVWFGTNRRLVDRTRPALGFSGERDDVVRYGACDVIVPKSHRIGSLGSPFWKRLLSGQDDRLKLRQLRVLEQNHFWRGIQAQLSEVQAGSRTAVVFLHGYNVSFDAAALRAAQIGFDLSVQGAMAFYSWPSAGKVRDYIRDEAAVEASEHLIANFLSDFVERCSADKINLIAHSMGNRGLLRAINRIANSAQERSGKTFNQIILAAPDVDSHVFKNLCAAYVTVAERTTLYVSTRDRAVEMSAWLHDFPRAGIIPPPVVVSGIDTVNVTSMDISMLGHGYIGEARGVLVDVHQLFSTGAPPEERFGLRLVSDEGLEYWEMFD